MTDVIEEGRQVEGSMVVEQSTVALLNQSEINQQIVTAHRFPRSVAKFRQEALSLVTLTEDIAEECIYALPRDGKTIEGPSARFAEVVASCWGNSRAGARVVSEVGEFVTAQGVFHDLERNVAITYEVQRRIVDKKGNRYKADMIGVTANAACSIALRNAILKGVPKALWSNVYEAARRTVMGDFQTLANRRAITMQNFQKFGVKPEQVLEKLGVKGEDDITLEHIVTLRGMLTALKEGETTVEQMFAKPEQQQPEGKGTQAVKDKLKKKAEDTTKGAAATDTTTGETESLLDKVKRYCGLALEIEDHDMALLKLDDARVLLQEMTPANQKLAEAEIAAAVKSINGR